MKPQLDETQKVEFYQQEVAMWLRKWDDKVLANIWTGRGDEMMFNSQQLGKEVMGCVNDKEIWNGGDVKVLAAPPPPILVYTGEVVQLFKDSGWVVDM